MELTGFGNGTLCTSHQLTGVEFRVSIYSLQQVVCFTFLCFRWVNLLIAVNFMMEKNKLESTVVFILTLCVSLKESQRHLSSEPIALASLSI